MSEHVEGPAISRRRDYRPSKGRRIHVLVLTTTLPARVDDGTPAFVLTLAQELSVENDVTILAPRVTGAASREKHGNLEIKRFAYFPRPLEGLASGAIMPNLRRQPWRIVEVPPLVVAFLGAAVREVRRRRPDVVHAHWLLPGGVVALALHRIFGTPYIVTGHAADVFRFRGRAFQSLKRRVMAQAAIVSAVSRQTAAVLGVPPEEADQLVVPMGVDVAGIQNSIRSRQPEPGRFLFVGRLVEKKGLDVLLRALVEVPEARLVAVGDGPMRADLETLGNELGISGRVCFTGQLGQSYLIDELRLAHALVIPSRVARDGDADGTPVVMGEGMAAGVPIIASRLGGLSEHIASERNGLLVEPGDSRALAKALRRVLADPDAASRWAEEARRAVHDRLDVRETARRYQEFIDAAVGA